MQSTRPRPILKNKQLSIIPQPPTEHRDPPISIGKSPRTRRGRLPINKAIDYDKLTPTEQARWDAGVFGSIELREDVRDSYYCVRWRDPTTGIRRSTKLAHNYADAIAKLRELTCG
jgi:hypothetical protein